MQHGERHALAGDAEKTPRPLGLCAPQPIGRDLDRAEAVLLDATAAHRGGNVTSTPWPLAFSTRCSASLFPLAPWPCRATWPANRKSTRLNSSHGYISYAVFCLKKKKPHSP